MGPREARLYKALSANLPRSGPAYVSSSLRCVNTQAADPHFWGHLIVAIGTVLFCRAIRENKEKAEYTALNPQ
jgi:hypothetical protein